MARRLRVAATATRDLKRIADYSYRRWGARVVARYAHGLDDAMLSLRQKPSAGRNYLELHRDIYRYRFKSHFLYYTVSDMDVRIVRILHVRMSPKRHLP